MCVRVSARQCAHTYLTVRDVRPLPLHVVVLVFVELLLRAREISECIERKVLLVMKKCTLLLLCGDSLFKVAAKMRSTLSDDTFSHPCRTLHISQRHFQRISHDIQWSISYLKASESFTTTKLVSLHAHHDCFAAEGCCPIEKEEGGLGKGGGGRPGMLRTTMLARLSSSQPTRSLQRTPIGLEFTHALLECQCVRLCSIF